MRRVVSGARRTGPHLLTMVALTAFAYWSLGFLLRDDLYIFGDNPGQFFRLWYPMREGLSGLWRANDWNPSWYAGYPELQFYPPGFVYVGIGLNLLSAGRLSPFLTYELLRFAAYLLPALTTYALLTRLRSGRTTAIAAGLFTLIFPDVFGGIAGVQIGMLGDRLALALYPLALLAGIWGLERRRPFALAAALGIILAAIILLHPFQALAPMLSLTVYAILRRKGLLSLISLSLPAILAAGLVAFWLLPLLAHSDYATPVLRASVNDLQYWLMAGRLPFFAIFAVLGLASAFHRTDALRAALLAIGLTPAILLALVLFDYAILIDRLGFYALDPIRFIATMFLTTALLAGIGFADLGKLVLTRCALFAVRDGAKTRRGGFETRPQADAPRAIVHVLSRKDATKDEDTADPHPGPLPTRERERTCPLSRPSVLPRKERPLGAERVRVRAFKAIFKAVNFRQPAGAGASYDGGPIRSETATPASLLSRPFRQPILLLGFGALALVAYFTVQPLIPWREEALPKGNREPRFLSAAAERYGFEKLWTAIKNQPPGRLLVVSSQLRLRKSGETLPTYLFALLPYYTDRDTMGGTFHHWSPIATYYWYGRTSVPVMKERTDLMDNQSIFGMKWVEMDEETLHDLAKRFNVSTLVATEYDGLARAFLDKSKRFGATYNDGTVVLYHVNDYVPNLLDFAATETDAELVRYNSREIVVRVRRSVEGASLGVKVAYYPLWTAEVDGRPVPLSADELGLMRLRLPAGADYQISIRYAPQLAEQLGVAISVGTLAVIVVGLIGHAVLGLRRHRIGQRINGW